MVRHSGGIARQVGNLRGLHAHCSIPGRGQHASQGAPLGGGQRVSQGAPRGAACRVRGQVPAGTHAGGRSPVTRAHPCSVTARRTPTFPRRRLGAGARAAVRAGGGGRRGGAGRGRPMAERAPHGPASTRSKRAGQRRHGAAPGPAPRRIPPGRHEDLLHHRDQGWARAAPGAPHHGRPQQPAGRWALMGTGMRRTGPVGRWHLS